jgi:D-alanyl-lipoteichoic acid acyltransferase DltB (MBOAT superfamily)
MRWRRFALKEESQMIRTVFAMAVAALLFTALSGTSQAAPIAPMSGITSPDNGQVTKVYWRRWHHCHWRRCW